MGVRRALRGGLGASRGGLETLGGILGALSPKKPSRIPKDGPKSRSRRPQSEKNGTGAPFLGVSGDPQMTKSVEIQDYNKELDENTKIMTKLDSVDEDKGYSM